MISANLVYFGATAISFGAAFLKFETKHLDYFGNHIDLKFGDSIDNINHLFKCILYCKYLFIILFLRLKTFFLDSDFSEWSQIFRLLQVEPKNPMVLVLCADVQIALGKITDAIENVKTAVKVEKERHCNLQECDLEMWGNHLNDAIDREC